MYPSALDRSAALPSTRGNPRPPAALTPTPERDARHACAWHDSSPGNESERRKWQFGMGAGTPNVGSSRIEGFLRRYLCSDVWGRFPQRQCLGSVPATSHQTCLGSVPATSHQTSVPRLGGRFVNFESVANLYFNRPATVPHAAETAWFRIAVPPECSHLTTDFPDSKPRS